MKISYITFMIDIDYIYIYNLIKSIEKVQSTRKYDYELFIFDNRKIYKNVRIKFNNPNITIINSNKNCPISNIIDGVLNYATGDWIRIVDCDDNVLDLPKDLNINKVDADIIFCNSIRKGEVVTNQVQDSLDFNMNANHIKDYAYSMYHTYLYNSYFLKNIFLKKKDLEIPEAFLSFDLIMSTYILEQNPKIIFDDATIYGYNDGHTGGNIVRKNSELIRRKYNNFSELIQFIYRFIDNQTDTEHIISTICGCIFGDFKLIKSIETKNWLLNEVIIKNFDKSTIKNVLGIDVSN